MFTFKDVEGFYKNALEQDTSTRRVQTMFGVIRTHKAVSKVVEKVLEENPNDWDLIAVIFLHALMRSKDISDEQKGEKQKELH